MHILLPLPPERIHLQLRPRPRRFLHNPASYLSNTPIPHSKQPHRHTGLQIRPHEIRSTNATPRNPIPLPLFRHQFRPQHRQNPRPLRNLYGGPEQLPRMHDPARRAQHAKRQTLPHPPKPPIPQIIPRPSPHRPHLYPNGRELGPDPPAHHPSHRRRAQRQEDRAARRRGSQINKEGDQAFTLLWLSVATGHLLLQRDLRADRRVRRYDRER